MIRQNTSKSIYLIRPKTCETCTFNEHGFLKDLLEVINIKSFDVHLINFGYLSSYTCTLGNHIPLKVRSSFLVNFRRILMNICSTLKGRQPNWSHITFVTSQETELLNIPELLIIFDIHKGLFIKACLDGHVV